MRANYVTKMERCRKKRGKRAADIKKNPYQSWTVKILKGEYDPLWIHWTMVHKSNLSLKSNYSWFGMYGCMTNDTAQSSTLSMRLPNSKFSHFLSHRLYWNNNCGIDWERDRAFSFAALSLWNSLPISFRYCSDLRTFKAKLKTHLFNAAFDV